ncbi:MAG: 30S ribosomal protein S20 [Clostridiales bacterium]|nr:30S ribosomal protein S20 [Bacillota bacterium]MCR5005516.1 30S ribosomal protein S20 [Clostridiales bacterium]
MANIKSAKKRILVIQKKTLRNKMIKSAVKTAIKKVNAAIAAGDQAAAAEALKNATSAIDKAKSKGIFHKNTASRKVARLTKAVNRMA